MLFYISFKGDITPNTWPSKLFMAVMIIVALVVIPTQVSKFFCNS